jgi:hypothetical protein
MMEEEDMDDMMEEEDMDDMMEEEDMDDMMDSETIYEISFDDEDEMDFEEEDDFMMESKTKKSIKPKGVGIGKGPKKDIYSKNPNTSGGFQVVKKKANKTMGTGSAKKGFSYDSK